MHRVNAQVISVISYQLSVALTVCAVRVGWVEERFAARHEKRSLSAG
ncbi:hypothetical protein [Dapis sp. BLCC M172]